jgi:hypothetical protein
MIAAEKSMISLKANARPLHMLCPPPAEYELVITSFTQLILATYHMVSCFPYRQSLCRSRHT